MDLDWLFKTRLVESMVSPFPPWESGLINLKNGSKQLAKHSHAFCLNVSSLCLFRWICFSSGVLPRMGSVNAAHMSLAAAALTQPLATSLLLWITICTRLRKPRRSKDWPLWCVFPFLSIQTSCDGMSVNTYSTPLRSWGKVPGKAWFCPQTQIRVEFILSWNCRVDRLLKAESSFHWSVHPSSSLEPET